LDLGPRDEPELAEETREADPGALAEPDALAAPPAHELLDQRPRLLATDATARRQLLGQGICALGRQRHRADPGEDELLRDLANVSGRGHAPLSVSATGAPYPS